jgi:hypothetical protein
VQLREHGWEKRRRASTNEEFKTIDPFTRELFLTRAVTALLVIVLAVSSPTAAKCCSLGSGASYDFLGDPAMDIGMNSYDQYQFLSEEYPVPIATTADVKEAATSRIRLNLSNNSSIYLLLTMSEGSILGKGNVTSGNATMPAEAVGRLLGDKLSLDVTALSGEIYQMSLAAEGSILLGDYSLTMPDGERRNATAEGKWEI